jgi:leader peptidase (prepilin peptidase)/N-methyltransferase
VSTEPRWTGWQRTSITRLLAVSGHLAAAVVTSVAFGAVAGSTVPRVVRSLPEPSPATDGVVAAARTGAPVSYQELGGTPGLRWGFAAAGALTCACVAFRLGPSAVLPAWLYVALVGLLLAWVDSRTCLLPTRIIAPSYVVVTLLLVLASAVDDDWAALGRAGLGWALGGGTFFLMWFIYPKGLGYGDVRLAGLLSMALAWVGWAEFAVGMYAGFLLGGVVGGVLALARVGDRRRYPFGPFMVLGALLGLAFGQALADWYANLGG